MCGRTSSDNKGIAGRYRCYEACLTGFSGPGLSRDGISTYTTDTTSPIRSRKGALRKTDHGDAKLIVLDDIVTLEWIGFSLVDVGRYALALWGACLKVRRLSTRYFA